MWDLIVSVPDHCLSFYFLLAIEILLLMGSPKDSDLSMITPRSFSDSTLSIVIVPCGVCIV